MTEKMFVTSENVEMVNGILKSFGIESTLRFMNGGEYGSIGYNGTHARLSYDGHNGFYVSVSGSWLHDSKSVKEYVTELSNLEQLMKTLEINIKKG